MLAIILARKNIREFDQSVSLYTRDNGKLEILAKGIKKSTSKNSSNAQVLSLVDAEIIPGKEIDYLGSVQLVELFRNIYGDLDRLYLALHIVNLVDTQILPEQKDKEIFDLLLQFLYFLNTASCINASNIAAGFIWKLWYQLGFGQPSECFMPWLEGEWEAINNLVGGKITPGPEQAYEAAHRFAQLHVGRRLAKFIEHDRII